MVVRDRLLQLCITDITVKPGRLGPGERRAHRKREIFVGPQSRGFRRHGKNGIRVEDGGQVGISTRGLMDWTNVIDDPINEEARIYNQSGMPLTSPLKPSDTYEREDPVTGEKLRITYRGPNDSPAPKASNP